MWNGKKDFVDAMSDADAAKHFQMLKESGNLDYLGVDRWLESDELLGLVTDFVCHDIPRSRVQIPSEAFLSFSLYLATSV